MNIKTIRKAPLPFQGQKRNFLSKIEHKLRRLSPKIHTIVDLFGGSGLLSYTARRACPQCEVVYNDFDDYHIRLEHIQETNSILDWIRNLLADYSKNDKVEEKDKNKILNYLRRQLDKHHYLDYLTLSTNILFAMNIQVDLRGFEKSLFWNKISKNNYTVPDDYLEGLTLTKQDYETLLKRYGKTPGVLFLVDPPYDNTNNDSYRSGNE